MLLVSPDKRQTSVKNTKKSTKPYDKFIDRSIKLTLVVTALREVDFHIEPGEMAFLNWPILRRPEKAPFLRN